MGNVKAGEGVESTQGKETEVKRAEEAITQRSRVAGYSFHSQSYLYRWLRNKAVKTRRRSNAENLVQALPYLGGARQFLKVLASGSRL